MHIHITAIFIYDIPLQYHSASQHRNSLPSFIREVNIKCSVTSDMSIMGPIEPPVFFASANSPLLQIFLPSQGWGISWPLQTTFG